MNPELDLLTGDHEPKEIDPRLRCLEHVGRVLIHELGRWGIEAAIADMGRQGIALACSQGGNKFAVHVDEPDLFIAAGRMMSLADAIASQHVPQRTHNGVTVDFDG